MEYDVKLLDAIKDRIIVVGSAPVEDAAERANQGALWHFLLDGQPVSLVCSFPKGEPSQENDRAKEFLARDLYIKDPANRMTIKAEICREYLYYRIYIIEVSVPKSASDEEMIELAEYAALDKINEFQEFVEADYHFNDMNDRVLSLDRDLLPVDAPVLRLVFVREG